MSLYLSTRQASVLQSEIRNMTIECNRVGGINLAQGVCDTPVSPIVRRAAADAMDRGVNTYTHYAGLLELRKAIAVKQEKYTGLAADPETEIIVSAGATGAFYCACLALLDPGDEVILFEPYYGYHVNTLVAVQAVPTYVQMAPPHWSFNPADLERVVTPRTRAIMVNTPSNPTGKIFTRDDLETIAGFAEKHDLFVFTDEIYEHFLYDGAEHISPATLSGMHSRTITISGLSKTFSITGWRIGYTICDARWAQTIGFFNDLVYVCAPAPLQIGVAEGLMSLGDDYYSELASSYTRKRGKICAALKEAGLTPYVPQGAYYVLADISSLPGGTGKERAMALLAKTGVACVPGGAFFHDDGGEALGRFCFAKDDSVLDEACRRLREFRG